MTTATAPALSSPADVLRLLAGAQVVALDLETCGPPGRGMEGALNPRQGRVRLFQMSDGRRTVVLDAFEHPSAVPSILDALRGKTLIAFNAAFDLGWLWNLGLTDLPETVDLYLLAQLLHAGAGDGGRGFAASSLAACALRYLQLNLPKELQASDWSGPLSSEQVEYARRDAEVLTRLLPVLAREIDRAGLTAVADVELRALPAFVWLSQSGVPFDQAAWEALANQAAAKKATLTERLDAQAPAKAPDGLFGPVEFWNWDSPQQVGAVFTRLGMPVQTTADVQLALLSHPVADLVREHRHQATLLKMYGPNWLAGAEIAGGRVYPDWKQIGTVTGRTSCSRQNLQQIPRDEADGKKVYRTPFRAPPGKVLVKADYATLQMRIACKHARDEALGAVFLAGGDPHTATAQALLGGKEVSKADRQIAKSANFALL